MKVLVNGGLNLSELDGWWAEAYTPQVGWAIGDGREHNNDPQWDAEGAEGLYALLENEIVPMFYTRAENGVPEDWMRRVRESMATLTPQFSSERMVRQYVEELYAPAAATYRTPGRPLPGRERRATLAGHDRELLERRVVWRAARRAGRSRARVPSPRFARRDRTGRCTSAVVRRRLGARSNRTVTD
jgi:hypothetical protein